MSFVPNAGSAFIEPAKLTCLLATSQGKAKFFAGFGFDPSRLEQLECALRWHIRNRHYERDSATVHGMKYEIKCSVPSRDGRDPCIRSFWIVDIGQTTPRLVAAYPGP